MTAGRLLLKAQACVPVGSWGVWVESKCEFSVRTAQDYMRIARAFGEGRSIRSMLRISPACAGTVRAAEEAEHRQAGPRVCCG